MKYDVVAVGFHLMLFVIFCKIEKVKICFDLNLKFEIWKRNNGIYCIDDGINGIEHWIELFKCWKYEIYVELNLVAFI